MQTESGTQQSTVGPLRERLSGLRGPGRGQSDTIRLALIVGVVLVLGTASALFVFTDSGSQDEPDSVDIGFNVTADEVTLTHDGGDSLDSEQIRVEIESGGNQSDLGLLDFTEQPSESGTFASGDQFVERNVGAPYVGDVTVSVIFEPTNSTLAEESFDIESEIALTIDDISGPDGNGLSVGDDVSVTFTLDNQGAPESQAVSMRFDGEEVYADTLSVPTGTAQTETVTRSASSLQDGLEVAVEADGDSDARTFEGPATEVSLVDVSFGTLGAGDVSTTSTVDVEYAVENTGDIGDEQTIDLESRAGNETLIESRSTVEVVPAGESVTGTFTGVAAGPGGELALASAGDSDTLALGNGDFQVVEFTAPAQVEAGTSATVEYTVENQGEFSDTQDIELLVDDERADSEEAVTLAPGGTFGGSFSLDTAGEADQTLTVAVSTANDSQSTDVAVGPGATPTADFQVTNLTAPGQVTAGDGFTVEYTVENTGTAEGTQDVAFLVGGTQENSEESVTLAPDGTFDGSFSFDGSADAGQTVTVAVSTANDSESADVDVTAAATPVADFRVVEFTAPAQVIEGDSLDVEYTVENTGNAEGTQDVAFLVGGTQEDSDGLVTLTPGGTFAGSFTFDTAGEAGQTLTVAVSTANDSESTEVDVTSGASPTAAFEVTEFTVPEQVTEGDSLDVEYTVENTGTAEGTQDVAFLVGGTQEDSDGSVTLAPGETSAGSFTFDTAGEAGQTLTVAVSTANDSQSADVDIIAGATPVAAFEVVEFTAPEQVTAGDGLTVEYTVENTGTAEGTQEVAFLVSGTQESGEGPVTLAPGETLNDSFTFDTAGEAGQTLTVTVSTANDSQSADVDVTSGATPAAFEVVELVAPGTVTEGEVLTADYTVENTGNGEGTQDIAFFVDATQEDSEDAVTLAPGETFAGSFTFDTTGEGGQTLLVEVGTANDSRSTSVDVTAGAEIRASLDDARGSVGETVQVDLDVTSIDGTGDEFGSYTIVLSYDDSVLEFEQVVSGAWDPFGVNEPTNDSVALTNFAASGSTPLEPALTYEFEIIGSGSSEIVFDDSQPGGAAPNEVNDNDGKAYIVEYVDGTAGTTASSGAGADDTGNRQASLQQSRPTGTGAVPDVQAVSSGAPGLY